MIKGLRNSRSVKKNYASIGVPGMCEKRGVHEGAQREIKKHEQIKIKRGHAAIMVVVCAYNILLEGVGGGVTFFCLLLPACISLRFPV